MRACGLSEGIRKPWLSDKQEVWGQFGDFLGGVINPLVGLLTAFLVLLSVSIQRKEMKSANASAAKMSFEQSLFAWLANYQQLLNSVKDGRGRAGRDALTRWWEDRFSAESAWMRSIAAIEQLPTIGAATPAEGLALLRQDPRKPEHRQVLDLLFLQAQQEFDEVWQQNRVGIDPILRTLSRLFRWIDTSQLSATEKWHYVSLVCAQLSWIEQVYMLYYLLGAAPSWFGEVANKYSLLHGVDTHDALVVLIAKELTQRPPSSFTGALPAPRPWPLHPSAFEPQIARANLGLEQEPN